MKSKQTRLKDISEIKAGHPFRGKITETKEGEVSVIQFRDVNEDGIILWNQLSHVELKGYKTPDWLQKGDILFAARGIRNFAAYVDRNRCNTVCSQFFFLIRLNKKHILPEFIAWQLNQTAAQHYFGKCSQGTMVASIPRSLLEETPLFIPGIEQQKQIVALSNLYIKEKQVLQALIKNRELQMKGIIQHLSQSTIEVKG